MNKHTTGPWDQDDANARLIAAAPELLSSLAAILRKLSTIEVLGEWEALGINHNLSKKERTAVNAAIDDARAAIARATGAA